MCPEEYHNPRRTGNPPRFFVPFRGRKGYTPEPMRVRVAEWQTQGT